MHYYNVHFAKPNNNLIRKRQVDVYYMISIKKLYKIIVIECWFSKIVRHKKVLRNKKKCLDTICEILWNKKCGLILDINFNIIRP